MEGRIAVEEEGSERVDFGVVGLMSLVIFMGSREVSC